MSKRGLLPQTPEAALNEALAQLAALDLESLARDQVQGRLMIAIESLMYLLHWAGGEVDEYLQGVLFEMFEEGYVFGPDENEGENDA